MKKLIALVMLLCASALAQDHPLRQPVWELGPWFGGGTGLAHASEFKFISTGLRFGRVLTGELGTGRMRGTFEWAADIMPVYEVRQSLFYTSGPQEWVYSFATNPVVLKYNFTGGNKVVPYIAAEEHLQALAETTGGRVFRAQTLEIAIAAFGEVARELKGLYTLAYYPSNQARDGSARAILVTCRRPAVSLRYRSSYRAPMSR